MSALPAGVYTKHSMTTSGLTCITADVGMQFGNRSRIMVPRLPTDAPVERFEGTRQGASRLPAGVYTKHSMTTSGLTNITADSGLQFGSYAAPFIVYMIPTGGTPPTPGDAIFRRTLSPLGTRTGSRQVVTY